MPAPSAIDAFVRHITEARARLDVLQGFLGDHMGFGPDDINWGHVGTAAAVNGALAELMMTAGIDPEGIDGDMCPIFAFDGGMYSMPSMLRVNSHDEPLCEWLRAAKVGDEYLGCKRIA